MAGRSVPVNFDNPVLRVRHEYLARFSEDSPYKVVCPVCGGLLLVPREMPSMLLKRHDCCTRCGQQYIYLDDGIGGEPFAPLEQQAPTAGLIRLLHARHSPGRPSLINVRVFAGPNRDALYIAGVFTFEDAEWQRFREALFHGAFRAGLLVECEGAP